ncbi:MAG: T9SS type A sorting domain-containing protein [Bacteroidota bacterium]
MKCSPWYILGLAFLLVIMPASAQAGFFMADGNTIDAYGNNSHCPGQISFQSISESYESVTGGVQHPFEILLPTSVEISDVQLSLSVYPNPTAGELQLKVGPTLTGGQQYRLLDSEGRKLQYALLENGSNAINLSAYPPAVYFVQVFQKRKLLHTFQVIKN